MENKTAHLPRLMVKVHEAAFMLGVSPNTIRTMIKRGDLKVIRKLRDILIPVAELERISQA